MNKRVITGMSGGVDSSVAAYLLKQQGYDVIGVTMQIWQDDKRKARENEDGCCSLSAVEDARRVCNKLGIPFYVMNFKKVFEKKVIDYFVDEYLLGRTPNPCIACNKFIKFDALLERAKALEAGYVATGHYARIMYDDSYNRFVIKRSASILKDQTYVLYNLTQNQLSHILMPLGDYNKEQVRRIAGEQGFVNANRPESQEICFVEDNDYGRFIKERRGGSIRPGMFVDVMGNKLGTHKGVAHYTIGQRKGLGLSLGKPMYVVEILPEKNLVVLGDESEVFNRELTASQMNYVAFESLEEPISVKAKIRYSAGEADAKVIPLDKDRVRVIFEEPQRAITPGQAVVFYQGDVLIGGGTIER